MKDVQALGFWLRSVIGGDIEKYFKVQISQIIFKISNFGHHHWLPWSSLFPYIYTT